MIDDEEFVEWLFTRSRLTEGEIVEACGIDISDIVWENIDNLKDEYWDDFIKEEYPKLAEKENEARSKN